MWRPTPLHRARRLEKALGTTARIFYKYEGVSPAGSHKPNTAVAQAFYNKQEGVTKLSTETGAGQWGSALAFAGALFGLEVKVYMVKVSYNQKPYRRALMETYGAKCVASPSDETESGRAILAEHPDSPGSLGIAISEAVEVAAKNPDTKYALGSVLNHVLLHQTVIGIEAIEQMEQADAYPDVVIGCAGGGSNFAGIAFPFIGKKLRDKRDVRVIAVEPSACPSMTRGKYAYDFGDTGHLTPLVKMHTLGSDFIPPGFHAGGLRYHGMAPLVSHCKELGLIEARAYHQNPCFEAGVMFARTEGIVPGARVDACGQGGDRRGAEGAGGGQVADHPLQPLRPRPFRHAGLHRLFRRQARGSGLRSEGARRVARPSAEGGGGVAPAAKPEAFRRVVSTPSAVMAELVPAIHAVLLHNSVRLPGFRCNPYRRKRCSSAVLTHPPRTEARKHVDGRVKPSHDVPFCPTVCLRARQAGQLQALRQERAGGVGRPAVRGWFVVALFELEAALQNVTQAAQDRHIHAAGGLAHPFPVAEVRPADEMPYDARGEGPGGQVAVGGVALELAREVAADRGQGGASDMRIGAGGDYLTHDHSFALTIFALPIQPSPRLLPDE